MKKLFLFTAVLCSVGLSAQPRLTYQNHGLKVGDVHQTRAVTYCDPTEEDGPGLVWDYSGVAILGNVYDESLSAGTPGHNIDVTAPGGTTFSFNVTPTGNEYFGYKHAGFDVRYNQPILKTRFPFEFQDQHSGEFSGEVLYGEAKAAVDGVYSSQVDAYGTLILPNGVVIENALRVRTTEQYKERHASVHEVEIVKYLWYAQTLRYPVFVTHVINTKYGDRVHSDKTSHVSVAALNYVQPPKTVVVEEVPAKKAVAQPKVEKAANIAYSVYPNPVETEAAISYTLVAATKVSVKVYDMNGSCVRVLVDNETQNKGAHQYAYTPSVAGSYIVSFVFGKDRYSEHIVKK